MVTVNENTHTLTANIVLQNVLKNREQRGLKQTDRRWICSTCVPNAQANGLEQIVIKIWFCRVLKKDENDYIQSGQQ